nr:putative mitochondrial protein [Tanacetum cinerariifolium]
MKKASNPIESNKPLIKDEEAKDVDVHLYRSMIGSLVYLTASRSDITFAVCACARFQVTPKTSHLHAVKRIFKISKRLVIAKDGRCFVDTSKVTISNTFLSTVGLTTAGQRTINERSLRYLSLVDLLTL